MLIQLTSPSEAVRFQVMELALKKIQEMTTGEIEAVLTHDREKNTSTLIHLFMACSNPLLYDLGRKARAALERSSGSFPNIAYYYGRVEPERGEKELFRLYRDFPEERMYICKSIGWLRTPAAGTFLFNEAKSHHKRMQSMLPMLVGLGQTGNTLEKSRLIWFLEQNLNREEVISLSQIQVLVTEEEILGLYRSGGAKKRYAVEYLFEKPLSNFNAIRNIVDTEMENKNFLYVKMLLLSDGMRNIRDGAIRQYRENVLAKLRSAGY